MAEINIYRSNPDQYEIKQEYCRKIRTSSGEIYLETGIKVWEEFDDNLISYYFLENADNMKIAELYYTNSNYNVEHTMPSWWQMPLDIEALDRRYESNDKKPLATTNNVVTFATYMADGRLQLQQRGFVSSAGKPIGNPGKLSVNGGLMESNDMHVEVQREIREELGVDAEGVYVGVVYDAENGRCNHVFRVDDYEKLLENLAAEKGVRAVIDALTKPEGLGRSFVWREDWQGSVDADMETKISIAILREFPELMPPARPQAA